MGKTHLKTEEKEVIITQNAAGSNKNSGASDQDVETHIVTNNVLITVVLVIVVIAIYRNIRIYFGCRKWRNSERKWMENKMQNEFIRRMRQRLSGRFNSSDTDGRDAV